MHNILGRGHQLQGYGAPLTPGKIGKQELSGWELKKRCTKRELQSMTGLLQHAAIVVHPGRTFLRRLYDLLARVKASDHHVYLNAEARSDIAWWSTFVEPWNGVSLM